MATIPNDSTDETDGDGVFGLTPSQVMAGTAALLVIVTLAVGGTTLLAGDGTTGAAPQAQFGAEYDAATETLTIAHRSGDHLAASRVEVKITDTADGGTAVSGGHLWDGTIRPGDEITLQKITGEERITIVWEGDQRTVLMWTWEGSGV